MATGTIKTLTAADVGGVALVTVVDTTFTGTALADLVAAINNNDKDGARNLPNGSYAVSVLGGSSGNIVKATMFVQRVSNQYGGAVVASYLSTMNGAVLRKTGNDGTWAAQT